MGQHRPLTIQERAVLERLLTVEFEEVELFRAQVPAITVTAVCGCGCGSIELDVDVDRAPRAPSGVWNDGPDVLVEGDKRSWLMLFQNEGLLTELEHVAGYGPRPQDLDASTIQPELQVHDDWFADL